MATEEEDDPVVAEVDVYLSQQLSDSLALLQYPVRPRHMSYAQAHHLAARYKPQQQQLQLEVAVNTTSPSYATSKGEQIALNVDGSEPGDKAFYGSDKLDKQVLASTTTGPDVGRYVVGTLRDKELHLTPLRGVLQMRPTFGYLDQADAKNKDLAAETVGDCQDEEEEAKQVMVKFARQETEDAKARRVASFDYLKKKQEEERWVEIDFHHSDEPLAEAMRCKLYAEKSNDTAEFFLSQDDYLKKLIPKEETAEEKRPAMPNNILSMVELKTMSPNDQVKALLISAKVIRFNQLLSLLSKGTDPTAVLRIVQQVALLVQGCWVVKSEVLYPKDSSSAHSGIPAETLGRGRDYIMWRFTQNRHLFRKDLASVIKLPAEDVKDILEQMARPKVHKGWEFLMEFDSEFVNRHVEVVQRQQMLWERKFQQLSQSLNITKGDLKVAANAAAATLASPKRRRTVSRSGTKSGGECSISDLSDMDVDSQKTSERQRRHSGVDTHRQRRLSSPMTSRQRKISLMDYNSSDETHPHTVENGLTVVNPSINSPEPVTESQNGGQVDQALLKAELKKFAAERLFSRYVLSLSDFRDLFLRKLAECPPGHVLGSGVSDQALEQSLLDVGARKIPASPNLSESIYLRDKVGDGADDLRAVLGDLLQEKPSVRLTVLRRRVEEAGIEVPPDSELRKLLKDYCLVRSGAWHVKCGLGDGS